MYKDCMLYAGSVTSKGYAQKNVKINGIWKNRPLYREMYIVYVGEIPNGLVLDHLCRNRSCINSSHLEPVTSGENTRRGVNANKQKTHCKYNHKFTPDNTIMSSKGYRNCRECNNRLHRVINKRYYANATV